jgi:hypothetical protein
MFRRLLAPFSRRDELAAAAALGRRHPLVSALASRRALARQLVVTSAVVGLGVVGTMTHMREAQMVLGAAVLVVFALAVGRWFAGVRTRDHARELIAEGRSEHVAQVVADEARRLASRKERERLARSLEGYLGDAARWARIDPRSRPPAEIRCLLLARREADDVARLVRSAAPSPRGVAALWRFLTDGQRSSLFAGDVPRLRWELLQIATLLEPDASRRAQLAA